MEPIPRGQAGTELHLVKSAGAYAAQSADVLAGILESADELFAAFDADFRFIVFNAAFRREFTRVFGQAPALGETLQETLTRYAEQQDVIDLMRRAFGGEAFRIDREFSGLGRVYQITLTPVLNPEGKAVVVALVARDITEQRDAERKFRQLLEASPDAMLITRAGVIEYINAQAETMFGYAPQALVGKPLEILVPRHLHQQHIRERTDYENFPKTRPMGIGLDLRGVRADGTEIPVEISLSPITVAGQTAVAAAIRDISRRKRAEDALRQQNTALNASLAARDAELAHARQQLQQQIEAGLEREQALTQAMAQFQAVFEQAAAGIAIIRPDGHFMNVNPCLCDMTGYTREQLLQRGLHDITHPDDVPADFQLDAKLLSGAISSYTIDKRCYRQDGSLIWVALAVSMKRDAGDAPQYLVVVIRDITHRKLIEQKLGEAQTRLQMAVEIAQLGFWEWEPETNATYFSPEWKQQLGYMNQELPTFDEWKSRLHPDDAERIHQSLEDFVARPRGECELEFRLRHHDGSYRWFLSRMIAIEDPAGKAKKVIGIRLDITDRKEAEQHIRQAGQHDTLTGLPNRALLYEYVEHILAGARRSQTHGALLFIDIDHFKEINDTHGHEVGDAVLREVAQRLSVSIRKGDIAGRLGGDEFLVILPQVADALLAAGVAKQLLARLNRPYHLGDMTLAITPSIGGAMFPDNSNDPDTLVRHADHAMYIAKERGRNRVQFFTPELARRADDVQALENRIKVALQQNEFALHYQAIASAETAQTVWVEALLRWLPRSGKILPPREVIAVAEEIGLIGELGKWVLRTACEQQRQWQRDGMPPMRISVNISPAQFRHKDFAVTLERVIRNSGIDPALVQIELTENTVMQDLEKAIAVCNQVHRLGVRIALDNFGTGSCGLGSLSRLSVDTLKIDAAFVHKIMQEPRSEEVTQAAIALGRILHLEMAAVGIESAQALACVRRHQCDLVQGFHVGKPMSAQEFQLWYWEHGR